MGRSPTEWPNRFRGQVYCTDKLKAQGKCARKGKESHADNPKPSLHVGGGLCRCTPSVKYLNTLVEIV